MERAAERPSAAVESRVVVLGSVNIDSFVYLEHFPNPGETVFGVAGPSGLGGKGANQAIAASLLGARTTFIGMVGADENGAFVRSTLEEYGVDVSLLRTCTTAATGSAHINVNSLGENTIVVASAANAELTPDAVDSRQLAELTGDATDAVGLTQGELRAETIAAFAASCAAAGIRFVLNLAPFITVPRETLRLADPLIVNEGEAIALLGRSEDSEAFGVDEALAAVRMLAATVSASAVITLGADGAVAADGNDGADGADGVDAWHQPSPKPARVADTTGAGDAFVGALAATLGRGACLAEAVRCGVAAGSAAVTAHGTVGSYAALRELRPGAERTTEIAEVSS